MPSVISASLMIAIIYFNRSSLFPVLHSPYFERSNNTDAPAGILPAPDDLIAVLHWNPEFHSPPVFDLRKPYCQYSIRHLGGSVAHTDCPAQRNKAAKLSITALRTK